MPQFKNTVRPVVLLAHMGNYLLKISITYFSAYFIFVESLRYKDQMFFLCGSFGGKRLLVLTTLPYNFNSSIQGVCPSLLKLYITDLYQYCIFVESLCYKVLIFCVCRSFCGNGLFILTTFSYNSNSTIKGG